MTRFAHRSGVRSVVVVLLLLVFGLPPADAVPLARGQTGAGGRGGPAGPPPSALGQFGCPVTPITIGTVVNGAWTTSDCRSPFDGGSFYADRYSFTATAGQQVAIFLSSYAVDPYLF